jgi:hypothetical protein
MAAIPSALAAINTVIAIGSQGCPQTFTDIANIGDLEGPSIEAEVVDVTSHSTNNPWRQKIVTLLNAGQITIPLFFIPSSTGDGGHGATSGLLQVFTGRQLRWYRMRFPDTAVTTWYFQAYLSSFSMTAPVAGVETANVTFELTGQPILS